MSTSDDMKKANQATGERSRPLSNKSGTPESEQGSVGNVDKIREILVGNQMRDIEARITRLERVLTETSAELRQSTARRLEALENHFTGELETLRTRVKAEREERTEAAGKILQELKQINSELLKKIESVSDQGLESKRELRAESLKQSKDILAEIGKLQVDVSAALERRFDELHASKTDRAALAAILTELALRISDDLHLPGSES